MKNSIAFLTKLGFSIALFSGAAISGEPADRVTAIRAITVNGVSIDLPMIQLADGTVCQSYLAQASRSPTGFLSVKIDRTCWKA